MRWAAHTFPRLTQGLHAQILAHCQGSECETARLTERVTALEEKLQRLEQFVIEAEYDLADDMADVDADMDADEDNGASCAYGSPGPGPSGKDNKDPFLIVAP